MPDTYPYMWLLDDMTPPGFMTFGNFINKVLTKKIEEIFSEINRYIFEKEGVDLNHAYIDGTLERPAQNGASFN